MKKILKDMLGCIILFLIPSLPSFSQTNGPIEREIVLLKGDRTRFLSQLDSIQVLVQETEDRIKQLEVEIFQNNYKAEGYEATINTDKWWISPNGERIYPGRGTKVKVVGEYTDSTWKVLFQDSIVEVHRYYISFSDKNLNIEALSEKFKADNIAEEEQRRIRLKAEEDEKKRRLEAENEERIKTQELIDLAKKRQLDSIALVQQIKLQPYNDSIAEAKRIKQKEFELYLAKLDSTQNAEEKMFDEKGKSNFPFLIQEIWVSDINSANGVDFSIRAHFLKRDKTIKYIDFTVVPYNRVGDKVICEIRRSSEFTGRVTGPLTASYTANVWGWEAAWYNNTIDCLKLTKLQVQYTDGTTYTYIAEIPKILGDFKNSCAF